MDDVSIDTFAGLVGHTFSVLAIMLPDHVLHYDGAEAGGPVLTLSEVKPLAFPCAPGSHMAPFAVDFLAADEFPQGVFHLNHPDLGAMGIFLVPLGPEAGRFRLQAVFT